MTIRSREPIPTGAPPQDALVPRPDGWELAHLNVTDLQGNLLRPQIDYEVLRHGISGDYAVRLKAATAERVPQFQFQAMFSPEAAQTPESSTIPSYHIERLKPVIERLESQGFINLAKRLNELVSTHSTRNNNRVPGRDLEAVVRHSAFYSYRDENSFPKREAPAHENEFSPWRKFIAENEVVCAQCDATNEIYSTILESYYGENPSVRIQTRNEFHVKPGANQLRSDDLHARTHEFQISGSTSKGRTIYDATPVALDPLSAPVNHQAKLRKQWRHFTQNTRSQFVDWWIRSRNAAHRAKMFILRRNPNAALPAAPGPDEMTPPFAALPALHDFLNDGLMEPNSDPITKSSPLAQPPASTDPASEEKLNAITREMGQLRRLIQLLGGHDRMDPREGLLLADQLGRTYQKFLTYELSLTQTASQLNRLFPELNLSSHPTADEMSHGFTQAASQVMGRIKNAKKIREPRFAHYSGPQGEHIQIIVESLFAAMGGSRVEGTPDLATCISRSLAGGH